MANQPPLYKAIDVLLDSNPTSIQQFFEHYEFLGEAKLQNPRLGSYFKANPNLIQQCLVYVTLPPQETDSAPRKYKYPLNAVELVESQNLAIIECFFEPTDGSQSYTLLHKLFSPLLSNQEILPLLGSYLQRIFKILLRLKQNQLLDYIYDNSQLLPALTLHSYNKSLEQLLEAFVNLEYLKDKPSTQRLQSRLQVVHTAISEFQLDPESQKGSNLGDYLIDVIQRYHLIADGKKMLDQILTEQFLNYLFDNIRQETVAKILKALANYHCMSILNAQQPDSLSNKSNLQILQQQPFIRISSQRFLIIFKTLPAEFSYKLYRIFEVICHCICIRSATILSSLINCNFFSVLLKIFFSTDSNIFHSLAQKTFAHIFCSQKQIYEAYREHLFCDLDVIGMIVWYLQEQKAIEQKDFMRTGYTGYLISIIKVCMRYRGGQRVQEMVQKNAKAIQKIAGIIKGYDEKAKKDLGSYQPGQDKAPSQYLVTKITRRLADGFVTETSKSQDAQKTTEQRAPLSELFSITTLSQSIEEVPDLNPKLVVSLEIEEELKYSNEQQSPSIAQTNTTKEENQENIQTQLIVEEKVTKKQDSESKIIVQESSPAISPLEKYIIPKKPLTINIAQSSSPPPPLLPPLSSFQYQSPKNSSTNSFAEYMRQASKQAEQTIRMRRSSTDRQLTPVSKGLSPSQNNFFKKSWTNSSVQKNPLRNSAVEPKDLNVKIKLSKSPPRPSESKRWRAMESKDIPLLSFLGIIKPPQPK